MTSPARPGQSEKDGRRRIRIARRRPGESATQVQEYLVDSGPWTTVLDALRAIRHHQDRSLTIRYSCLHASCGTCGVRVNGQEVLGCVTPLADLGTATILVEPLDNAPVVHDLVVDPAELHDGLAPAVRPLVRRDDELATAQGTAEAPPFSRFEDCIECGLCVSACPITSSDPDYLGPAAIASAWRTVQEPRGADVVDVLAWVDDEQGCWRCHAAFECEEVCPSGVDPAQAAMGLRQELVRRQLTRAPKSPRRPR